MATIASKRKLNSKSIKGKYSALKYGIPKNILSTWLKNEDKFFEATNKESNSKLQQLRQSTFANLDQAMFKWLLVVQTRDLAVSALVLQRK